MPMAMAMAMPSDSFLYVNRENTYTDLRKPACIVGGCFSVVAVVLSLLLIFQHLRSYTNPAVSSLICYGPFFTDLFV